MAKLMVYEFGMAAAKTWRWPKGKNHLPEVVDRADFHNRIEVIARPDTAPLNRVHHPIASLARQEFLNDRRRAVGKA